MNSDKIAKENIARLNTAIEFIENNLSEKLSLEIIAEKAHFSPFHFHRLFKIVVNETVHNFINRKRIEKSAAYLLYQKEKNITEIAETVGYSNLSAFSKSFKKFYGISPNKFKEDSPEKYSKICKTESNIGKVSVTFQQYICNINNAINWLSMKTSPEIKKTPRLDLATISYKGKMEGIGSAYNRLVKWATPKGLINEQTNMVTIYHDSPKITDPNNLRMSACLVLKEPIELDGEVNLKILSPTKCIVSRLEITPFQFQQAWESSFAFMIENGYKKSEIDPFEIYYNNAAEHPENKFIVDLCIPIL
ncbi:AraC family transcriptional regulator [Polaribacter sargassicola]|uniref:AraC family transcriptional regulator n=1 Tax=Polaribacter sargassicola TaxID=2836891 RepID=UPI001F17874C|nr:GyrI-like domain-containing protein [Polaribacter sp. DS7-9]MCG1035631.1 AraC family transcriptional regulator [Polaribacter sp. DS7-9]